tara:strand:+ start:143 stop:1435 length:1293 start_codon:yes stop_codon:yes gene_type:complete
MKKFEENIDRRFELLKKAEKMMKIGHWYYNLKEQSLHWSDEIFAIHGLNPEDGEPDLRTAIDFYHPEDAPHVEKTIQDAIEKKAGFDFELRLISKDGSLKYVMSIGEADVDNNGEVVGVLGFFQDITQQKEEAIQLESSKDFFEKMMETIPQMVFVKDESLIIRQANTAFLEMYAEGERDKVIGSTTFEDYPDDQVERFIENDNKALSGEEVNVTSEIDFPSGERKKVLIRKTRFFDKDDNKYVLGVLTDITDFAKEEDFLKNFVRISQNTRAGIEEKIAAVVSEAKDLLGAETAAFFKFNRSGEHTLDSFVSDLDDDEATFYCESIINSFILSEIDMDTLIQPKEWKTQVLSKLAEKKISAFFVPVFAENNRYGYFALLGRKDIFQGSSAEKRLGYLRVVNMWIDSEVSRNMQMKKLQAILKKEGILQN